MVFLTTLAAKMSERLTWVLKIKFNVFNVVIVVGGCIDLKNYLHPFLTRIVLFYGLRNEFHPSNQHPPTTTMGMN